MNARPIQQHSWPPRLAYFLVVRPDGPETRAVPDYLVSCRIEVYVDPWHDHHRPVSFPHVPCFHTARLLLFLRPFVRFSGSNGQTQSEDIV